MSRYARPEEAAYLSDLASRSKAHWPHDEAYLAEVRALTHITPEYISSWPVLVEEVDGQIAGFTSLAIIDGAPMLDHLWIEPEFIGRKLGQRLFDDALGVARTMGWMEILIASDPFAESFYVRQGALRIGERRSKIRADLLLPLLRYTLR